MAAQPSMLEVLGTVPLHLFRKAAGKRIHTDLADNWMAFGATMAANPTFHAAVDECPRKLLQQFLDTALRNELGPRPGTSRWMDTRRQPRQQQERLVMDHTRWAGAQGARSRAPEAVYH